MSVLTFLLFKLNTLQKKIVKAWVSRSHGVLGGCFVTTQCLVVKISQSENRNSYSVWKLNNKKYYISKLEFEENKN